LNWTLAKAKDQLSRVIRQAVDEGPQTISVRGRQTAVVIGKEEYDRLRPAKAPRDFKAFLLAIPSKGSISSATGHRRATSSFEVSARYQRRQRTAPAPA
jgi:prevent-host-death family protein